MVRTLFITAWIVIGGGVVFAQVNATVGGTASDATGPLIPGVEVTATNINTGIVTTVLTNEAGTVLATTTASVGTVIRVDQSCGGWFGKCHSSKSAAWYDRQRVSAGLCRPHESPVRCGTEQADSDRRVEEFHDSRRCC